MELTLKKMMVSNANEVSKKILKNYHNKYEEILKFIMDNGASNRYEGINIEVLEKNIGPAYIDVETSEIVYEEQSLDDEHIFIVEYSGEIEKLLSLSIEG